MPPIQNSDLPIQSIDQALGEIDRLLHQMLLLAELSASRLDVDREALQKIFDSLQEKIDQIAAGIEDLM